MNQPIHDDKYIETKVKRFSGMINALLLDNEIPEERNHYICIAEICIDSILKVEKKKLFSSLLKTIQMQNKKKKASKFY